jgi:hypothetical protein
VCPNPKNTVCTLCRMHDFQTLLAGIRNGGSQSNRVTLVRIRTEVSRHFKEIMALGFGTCRLGCPAAPGDLKGMINKFNIALGQTQWHLHTKWWTKNISRSHWISNHSALLRSAPGTCKAGFRIEINAKARENRLTILK